MREPIITILFALFVVAGCGLATNNSDRLDRAERSFANGEYRTAILDCKDVLQREPDNLRGRLLLGRTALALGDGAGAQKEIERALDLGASYDDVATELGRSLLLQNKFSELTQRILINDNMPPAIVADLHRLLGDANAGLGEFEKARAHYDSVLDMEPGDVDAKLGIVSTLLGEGRTAQARSSLDELIRLHADNGRVWLASGSLDLDLNDPEGAVKAFAQVLETADSDTDRSLRAAALAGLAESQIRLGRLADAGATVELLAATAPKATSTFLLEARLAYLNTEFDKAKDILLRLLQYSPNDRRAQLLLGAVHFRQGNFGQAEMYLSAVVAAVPESSEARRLLAEVRLRMEDVDSAWAALVPILNSGTTDASALSTAAAISIRQARMSDAIELAEQGVEANADLPEARLQLALVYLQSGRIEDAEQVLQDLPDSGDAVSNLRRDALLVISKIQSQDVAAALSSAATLVERFPSDVNAYNLYAAVALVADDQPTARAAAAKGLAIAPDDSFTRRLIALMDEAGGDLDAARSQYEHVLLKAPGTPWALFSMARLAVRKGDKDEARAWLDKAIEADPGSLAPRLQLARLALEDGQSAVARKVLSEAMANGQESAAALNLLGIAALVDKNFDSAEELFRRALELDGSSAAYRLNLARTLKASGDMDGAIAIANWAPDDFDDIGAVIELAAMRANSGDVEGALELARGLQAAHPDHPVPLALEAELYAKAGDVDRAELSYDRALKAGSARSRELLASGMGNESGHAEEAKELQEQAPFDAVASRMTAKHYLLAGRRAESIAEYERILAQDPRDGVALNNLAWLYSEAGDPRAEATARKALEAYPDDASVLDTLGWILVQNGSVEEAESLLRRADELSSGRPEILYHLAVSLTRMGRADDARLVLERLLAKKADFAARSDAETLLSQL